jgi:hypothetical protein
MEPQFMSGAFVEEGGETWYRITGYDRQPPFFITLAGDSDLWAFISTAGSLTAGRRDQDGAFLPYETVDKIHRRGEHTGPRTWVRVPGPGGEELWEPFVVRRSGPQPQRSVWKNLSGTRLRFREEHPSGRMAFEYEWATTTEHGLTRRSRVEFSGVAGTVRVLDGILNLVPPGISFAHSTTMSSLTDAYKWNESAAGGRLGLFTLYARIWDRAEPKESFEALTAWYAGLPTSTRTLLSDAQVDEFCRAGTVEAETLTRGRRGAFLVNFDQALNGETAATFEWWICVDGPKSQVEVDALGGSLSRGERTAGELADAVERNTAGLDELLARADGFQTSGDPMAAAHHRANVLFNIMRGGVFVQGTLLDKADFLSFAGQRHRGTAATLAAAARDWPARIDRAQALERARKISSQAERLVLEYLPLTFSRRHGDPSRPWNRFSIQVRDAAGARLVNYQGNWRDIFQNWEALIPSEPAYLGSMMTAFLGAMTPDGYNPYRIGRDGIDWEVPEPDNPWSQIGYWGDHQTVYLLKFLEAARDRDPAWLQDHWDRALFSFGDVPYRLKPHLDQTTRPKSTIAFDDAAHRAALSRAQAVGSDGRLVCGPDNQPVLATLGEKLAILLLAKAGSLVPGGGLWLHTQRPEWNDANNALVGTGLSVVTLAYLRRFLVFLTAWEGARQPFSATRETLGALEAFGALVRSTPATAGTDPVARRAFLDGVGTLLDTWRAAAYRGSEGRTPAPVPGGVLVDLARDLLPLVDATLAVCRRDDGLFHSYNLVDLSRPGVAEVGFLYPMLEGQVAVLSSGFLDLEESVLLLEALFASALYTPGRKTFLLYPDRDLPRFLDRNRLDGAALALPITTRILDAGRSDLLQRQGDGTVRFAPKLANRTDLEAAGADFGCDLVPLAEAYDRILHHHEFTGRSGTMFGFEGLGCVYWHMVAKLLLAVQERVFEAADRQSPHLGTLAAFYRRIRDGLGYKKTPAEYGAFPADPYSHTPGEGGAQQPGMTGQVKEEILTRWGELGLRMVAGLVRFDPVLLDRVEIPEGGELVFTWNRVPYRYRQGPRTSLRVRTAAGWKDCPDRSFDPRDVEEVTAEVYFQRG